MGDASLNIVDTEIENQKSTASLMDRVKAAVLDDDPGAGDPVPSDVTEKRGRGRPVGSTKNTQNKNLRPDIREDINTLVAALVAFGVALVNLPEDIKPNQDEINGVSSPLSKILLRHFPVSNKLSGDVLDAIMIFVTVSAWYSRVAPAIKQRQTLTPTAAGEVQPQTAQPNPAAVVSTPISRASASTGDWLNRQLSGGSNNA